MRIGLETTWINVRDGGGRYTNEMVRHLCRRFPDDEFVAFGPEPEQRHDHPNLRHVALPDTQGLKARLRYALSAGRVLKRHGLDVHHNLVNFGVYGAPCPQITTVHDLLTYKYPQLRSSRLHGWLYRYYVPSLVKKAARVVTDSESSKRDLEELYGLGGKVTVVPLGYNRALFNDDGDGDDAVLADMGIEPGYLLFVGNLIPKKNIGILVRALYELRKNGGEAPRLVLAGMRGYGSEGIFRLAAHLGVAERVTELGYVPDDVLPALYRRARVFLFPSVYEGFGLPVVEAMACGTPVLVSDAGPLPELANDARFRCPPDDARIWAARIVELLDDDTVWGEAKRWALERSTAFSWEQCADSCMDVYRTVAGG